MPTIELEMLVMAPIGRCFDLARSIDLHVHTQSIHREQAVSGTTTGLIGLGEEVTWEATHFYVRQRMGVRIVEYDRPTYFCDTMVSGAFKNFSHKHYFEQTDSGQTIVRDVCDFASPLGPIGRFVDAVAIKRHLCRLLLDRNAMLKRTAEGEGWRKYVQG